MIWFLKALRAHWLMPAMIVLGASSALLMGQTFVIPVIDANATFGQMPYTVVTPLVGVVLVGYLTAETAIPSMAISARPHRLLLATASLTFVSVYAAAHWLTLLLVNQAADLSAARNVFGYTALLLIGQAWAGMRYAPLFPVIYVVIATIFGRIRGIIQPWAWPALPGSVWDLLFALVIAFGAAALVAFASRPRPQPS